MAYASWSVTFGEQPTAAKWNILGTNDAGFNDGTAIGDDAIQARHIDWNNTGGGDNGGIWWEELGRTTLGSAGDTISVTPIAARKYLKILVFATDTGGTITASVRFNNDTAANYSYRNSSNGGADGVAGSGTSAFIGAPARACPTQIEAFVTNTTANEKIIQFVATNTGTAGAGAAPDRLEGAGKWANTSTQITRVDVINGGAGDYAIGSEVVVLGHN